MSSTSITEQAVSIPGSCSTTTTCFALVAIALKQIKKMIFLDLERQQLIKVELFSVRK
jgi:hypothetical protein